MSLRALVVAAALAPALAACQTAVTARPTSDGRGEATTRRGRLEQRMFLTGTLEAVSSEKLLVPRTPNWMVAVRWLAEDGTRVKKGERVAEFDTSSFAGALSDKRQAVAHARADLINQEAQGQGLVADKAAALDKSRAAKEKADVEAAAPADLLAARMHQEKKLAQARESDTVAKAEDEVALAARSAALDTKLKQLALARAERELTDIEKRLGELALTAPRDGLVQVADNPREGRKFQIGDQAWAGFPIVTMPELAAMQVRARLFDVDDGTVAPGMPAECVLDAYPSRRFAAKVATVSTIARPEGRGLVRAFDVVIDLEKTDAAIMLPGLSVRVEVVARRAEDAVIVPRGAVRQTGNDAFVRLAGGREERVEIAFCAADACALSKGMAEGARVTAATAGDGEGRP